MSENMRIWDAVSKTNPAYTKKVNQRGGFTAISAHYQIMQATETFGPIGIGWGYENGQPIFQDGLVIVPVTIWHGDRANTFGPLYGSAEVHAFNKLDSDCAKKASTDGLTKGLSQLGFNADVFLGRFDDNKYVQEVTQEFAEEAKASGPTPRTKLDGPHTSKTALMAAIKALTVQIGKATSSEDIDTLLKGNATVKQAQRDWPQLLDGDPDNVDDKGLKAYVAERRAALAAVPEKDTEMLGLLLKSMKQCDTLAKFTAWMGANEPFIDGLDDVDRRALEREVDTYEAGLKAAGALQAG